MTWTRFQSNIWGTDAKPIGAAEMVDLVRGNCDHLMREPPLGCSTFYVNSVRATAATTYTDASVLWRSPKLRLFPGLDRRHRNIVCKVMGYLAQPAPATIRLCISNVWRVVADPPGGGDAEAESAAGEIVSQLATAPTEVTLTLTPPMSAISLTQWGTGSAGRGVVSYRTCYLQLQAIVPLGGTVAIQSFNIEEVDA